MHGLLSSDLDSPPMSSSEKKMSSLPHELPIDDTYTGDDSGDEFENSATSRTLASTVRSYRFENGRRYHSYRDGAYWGPNDERDHYHQLVTHHLFTLLLEDKLFLAPVSDPRTVLDIGTGIGLWAIDFADHYPETQVIGTDLSPEWEPVVQPNLRFEVDDCCSEWTYPPEYFDFIHIRGLYGSIDDWPGFYKQCYAHLEPGGYIEEAEFGLKAFCDDGTLQPDSVLHKYFTYCTAASANMKKDLCMAASVKDMMVDAGFVDIVEHRYKVPLGPWSSDPRIKEIGRWYREFWDVGLEGWWMAIGTRYLGWTTEGVHSFLAEVRKEMHNYKLHTYFEIFVVHGRRPQDDAT